MFQWWSECSQACRAGGIVMHPSSLTGANVLIRYSCGVGKSAERPEFPDQEAEEGVLRVGIQTGRADRKQQVSVERHPFPNLRSPEVCTHGKFFFRDISVVCFMKRHPSKLLGQITSTLHILPPSLTCFLVNLMLQ